jgi:hypothetical protein
LVVNNFYKPHSNILPMKPGHLLPRSADAFHKWSDQHRAQLWNMIEKLGRGEVSHKEARELLREEKKALSAVSKHLFRFKTSAVPPTDFPEVASLAPKAHRAKRSANQRASSPPRLQ